MSADSWTEEHVTWLAVEVNNEQWAAWWELTMHWPASRNGIWCTCTTEQMFWPAAITKGRKINNVQSSQVSVSKHNNPYWTSLTGIKCPCVWHGLGEGKPRVKTFPLDLWEAPCLGTVPHVLWPCRLKKIKVRKQQQKSRNQMCTEATNPLSSLELYSLNTLKTDCKKFSHLAVRFLMLHSCGIGQTDDGRCM